MKNSVIIEKVVSEKSFANADSNPVYTFWVDVNASKYQVKDAVEEEYKVKVEKVRVITIPGKLKRDWVSNKKFRKSDRKKAIVTLKEGKIKNFNKI